MTAFNRGLVYYNLGQLDSAILDFTEAIRLDPQLPIVYASRAKAYTLLGQDTEAQRDVKKAIELGTEANPLRGAIEQLKRPR